MNVYPVAPVATAAAVAAVTHQWEAQKQHDEEHATEVLRDAVHQAIAAGVSYATVTHGNTQDSRSIAVTMSNSTYPLTHTRTHLYCMPMLCRSPSPVCMHTPFLQLAAHQVGDA